MDVKYTIEILIKDIQDIEKLVGSLQNSPEASTLELDLALSKIRHLYDVLTLIRSDVIGEAGKRMESRDPAPVAGGPDPVAGDPDPVAGGPDPVAGDPDPAPGDPDPAPATFPREPEVTETDQTKPAGKQEDQEPEKKPGIVAETFSAASSINENMAGKRTDKGDAKLVGEPIDSISRNIGINDRFLIIRELFDGDADRFRRLVEELDSAGQREEALNRLSGHFGELPEHEGITILQALIKRRYPAL